MWRPLLFLVLCLIGLAGCGSPSTLPEDDQTFCAEQEDELELPLSAAREILDGDRHWSSDGEPYAIRQVRVEPASNFVNAFEPQDPELAEHVERVSKSLFYLGSDLLVEPEDTFADDAASSKDVVQAIELLQEFCDEKG